MYILIGIHLFQVDNFVHADMHPGNILVRIAQPRNPNNTLLKSRPHVVFLDVGMTAELSSNDRVNLLEFFKAVARRDGRTAAESTLKLSKQQNCPNPKVFIEVIIFIFILLLVDTGDAFFFHKLQGDFIGILVLKNWAILLNGSCLLNGWHCRSKYCI